MSIDVKAIMMDARAEIARRNGCSRHSFPAKDSYNIGDKLTCGRCGCSMRLPEIGLYARGYQAAGGDPDDVLVGLIAVTPQLPLILAARIAPEGSDPDWPDLNGR